MRSSDQNAGQTIRLLGARRIVVAYDPAQDDPDLVRTVIKLRAAALATQSRRGADQLATAEEKINEAITQLEGIDLVKKTAVTIQKSATKIETRCTTVYASIHRLMAEALAALTDAQVESPSTPASDAVA